MNAPCGLCFGYPKNVQEATAAVATLATSAAGYPHRSIKSTSKTDSRLRAFTTRITVAGIREPAGNHLFG
jgi:hypothetical protein